MYVSIVDIESLISSNNSLMLYDIPGEISNDTCSEHQVIVVHLSRNISKVFGEGRSIVCRRISTTSIHCRTNIEAYHGICIDILLLLPRCRL